jgi:lactoylglutathione lyase
MSERPFRVLGVQQIAVGSTDKARLRHLWIDLLGLTPRGTYRSERENVDEDIAVCGAGAAEVEVVYQFLEAPGEPVSATFTTTDVEALEDELGSVIARIREGEFRPTPSDFACAGCPALDRVCAGPRLGSEPDAVPLPELTAAG